jgi:thymidylate kinase
MAFFIKLESLNVKYCILGGYEGLPGKYDSSDMDIVVSKDNILAVSDVLTSIFHDHGSAYYTLNRYKGRLTYYFYFLADNGVIEESLKIDLFENFEFRARVFLTAREIINCSVRHNHLNIPSALHIGFMAAIKGVLKGGGAWKKYISRIQKGIFENREGMEHLLSRVFFRKTVDILVSRLNKGDIEEVEAIRKRMIHETYIKSFLRNPIRFPWNMLSYMWMTIRKTFNPPKYTIALLGPDGVGKSTLIRHMENHLMGIMKTETNEMKTFHIRPGVFPTITELLNRKKQSSGKTSVLRDAWQSPSSVISFIRILCFWVDYMLGYIIKILPELVKYRVVVLDRYFFDILIDPLRYKIRLPNRFMKILFMSIPRPRIIIVLDAPPDVIFRRKRELNEDKIGVLLDKYRNIKNEYENVHIFPATIPPRELSVEVVSAFLKCTATRLS